MKIARWLLVVAFAAFSVSMAKADSVDPRFVPIGGNNSVILTSPTDAAFQISFTRDGNMGTVGCGTFLGSISDDQCIDPANTSFINFTGQTWDSITLEITQHTDDLVFNTLDNSIDPYFANAESGVLENGNAFVRFFGIDATHPGIQSATSCDIEFGCTGPTQGDLLLYDFAILADISDMANGDSFTAQGTATIASAPEPASILLALVGGLILFVFKRR